MALESYQQLSFRGRLDLQRLLLGSAIRWEDENVLGYLIIDGFGDGQLVGVHGWDHPLSSASDTKFDFWFGYQMNIRDGEVAWKLQLNVRNALDHGDVEVAAT